MANLTLRVLGRAGDTTKNAPLTNAEIDQNFINLDADLDLKANINSPALTGTPTAPTAPAGTNTTQIATTAFVNSAIGTGVAKFGLGAAAASVPGNNIDDNAIPTGTYFVSATTSGTKPYGDDGSGHLIVSREGNGTTARQLYLDNTSARISTRVYVNAAWSEWRDIYQISATSNIVGLVQAATGGGAGAYMARSVEMTKMPELVAFMHSMIGLAAVFIAVAAVAEPWAFQIVAKGQPIPVGNRLELPPFKVMAICALSGAPLVNFFQRWQPIALLPSIFTPVVL